MNKCSLGLHTRVKDKRNLIANLSNFLDCKYNTIYTEEDDKKKCEIFDIPNVKTDFISYKRLGGCGDHYIDLVGSHSKNLKNKLIGSDSKWNLFPVTGNNSKYKKCSFISEEESYKLCEDEKRIYDKIYNWKQYVKSRNALMFHNITDEVLGILKEWERHMIDINQRYFDKLCKSFE